LPELQASRQKQKVVAAVQAMQGCDDGDAKCPEFAKSDSVLISHLLELDTAGAMNAVLTPIHATSSLMLI